MARKTGRRAKRARKRVLVALGYHDHQLYRGVHRFAGRAGWVLDTSPANYGEFPTYWWGDGVITLAHPDRTDLIEHVRATRSTVVSLTDDVDFGGGMVLLDNRGIGAAAAEHFLERGFRAFAFLGFSDVSDVRGRERGFVDRLRREGLAATSLRWWDRKDAYRGDWYEWLVAAVRELPTPVGVFAQSDNRAVCLLDACEAAGLRVPEQVAIVGVDNKEMVCTLAATPISSIDCDRERLAYEGCALLDRMMDGERPPARPKLIPVRTVFTRASSNILAIGHKDVASALSMIWERYAEPISVEDVVEASAMSRVGLYRAFEKHVGRSIGDEIERKRIEHAKRLLAGSDDKLHLIAAASGFGSSGHLSRVFRRAEGTTPSAYRRERRLSGQ